jgi:hypothetical protein
MGISCQMRTWTKETDQLFFEMWEHAQPEEIAARVNDWHESNAKSKGLSFAPVTTARGVMYHALKHGLIPQSDVDAYDKQQSSDRNKRKYISTKVAQVVLERDGNKCLLCGSQVDLHVSHIQPVSRGGTNEPDNLQTLCAACRQETRLLGVDFRKPFVKQWCEHCQTVHYKNKEES